MTVYMINLAVVYIFSYLSRISGRPLEGEGKEWKDAKLPLFIAGISLVLVAGLRYKVGTDFSDYMSMFRIVAGTGRFDPDVEIGFNIYMWLLSFISKDPAIMFFVTSLIINVFMIMAIKDHANPLEMGLFLYITTFVFYSSFNGIRQYVATAVLFWAVRYVIEKKFIKYLSIVLLMTLFHSSAIVLLPAYFLVQGKFKSLRNFFLITVVVAAYGLYGSFVGSLFYVLSDTKYAKYETWLTNANDGANIFRVLVMLTVLMMSFVFYNKLMKINKENNVFINFYLIGFLIMLFSLKNWLFARIADYFTIYGILLIPSFTRISDKNGNVLIKIVIMFCYFLYSYLLLLSNESNVMPYRSIINF